MSAEHLESLANVDRDELHPLQIEALRKMSPARKMQLVCAAIQMARDVRAAAVRAAHPEWSERQIHRAALLDRLDDEGLGDLFRRLLPESSP